MSKINTLASHVSRIRLGRHPTHLLPFDIGIKLFFIRRRALHNNKFKSHSSGIFSDNFVVIFGPQNLFYCRFQTWSCKDELAIIAIDHVFHMSDARFDVNNSKITRFVSGIGESRPEKGMLVG